MAYHDDEEAWFNEDDEDEDPGPPAAGGDEDDPLDAFMRSLNQIEEPTHNKSEEELMDNVENFGHLSGDAADLLEHLEKKRRMAESESEDDGSLSASEIQQLMPKPNRKTQRVEVEEESDYEEGQGNTSPIPTDLDWARLTAQRQRASTLPAIPKSVYVEHPRVAESTYDQIARMRRDQFITTSGLGVNKCMSLFEDLEPTINALHSEGLDSPGYMSRALFELRKESQESPSSLESQVLPLTLSGRDVYLLIPPDLRDRNDLFSGDESTSEGDQWEALSFVLLLSALSVCAQVDTESKKNNIASWATKVPQCVFACSTDARARLLYKHLNRWMQLTQALGARGVEIALVSKVAETAPILVGSAEKLMCLWNREHDLLPLEDVYQLIFADPQGRPEYDAAIAHILLTQSRPDKQVIVVSSTSDPSLDTFVKDQLTKPVRVQIGGSMKIFHPEPDCDHKFQIINDEEKKLNWVSTSLAKFTAYGRSIIFCASHDRALHVYELLRPGLRTVIHLTEKSRELSSFKLTNPDLVVITTSSTASKLLRGCHFALVIGYDPPASCLEFIVRTRFAASSALVQGDKAWTFTVLNDRSEKVAAYISEAIGREEGRKKVPKNLDDLAFRYGPYKKALLESTDLIPSETSLLLTHHGSFVLKNASKRDKNKLSLEFVKSQSAEVKELDTVTVIPAPIAPERPQTSLVLDTARLRARREANLAKFNAERKAARQLNELKMNLLGTDND